MDKNTVATKVAEEHRKLKGIIEELRGAAVGIPPQNRRGWLEELRERFFRFRAHMIHRVALEEVGGFFAQVVEKRPALARDVEHLQRENRDILASIEQVHQSLGDTSPDDVDRLEHTRLQIHHILSAVRHHTEHEDLLVGLVNTQDPGGEA